MRGKSLIHYVHFDDIHANWTSLVKLENLEFQNFFHELMHSKKFVECCRAGAAERKNISRLSEKLMNCKTKQESLFLYISLLVI